MASLLDSFHRCALCESTSLHGKWRNFCTIICTPCSWALKSYRKKHRLGNHVSLICFSLAGVKEQSSNHMILKAVPTVGLLGATCPFCSNLLLYHPVPHPTARPKPVDPGVSWFQRPTGMWYVYLYIERHTSIEATSSLCFLVSSSAKIGP